MKIGITGSTGLVGRSVAASMTADGHKILRFVRRNTKNPDEISWSPDLGELDREELAGLDVVVHLAGENVASGRWTTARKRRILESRVKGTALLAEAMAAAPDRPALLIQASAIGACAESGFLFDVCQAWEAASQPAEVAGVRVVRLRFGVILSRHGGALKKMLPPFRLGLGGRLGSGRQWMSWISLRDTVGAIRFSLAQGSVEGAYNTVSPNPVRNVEFTRELARALHRPAPFPVPAFVLRAALGEMADEMLLSGVRADADKLIEAGFEFQDPLLAPFLREELS
jgi:uncharacterized protein (TIGR01777 family)